MLKNISRTAVVISVIFSLSFPALAANFSDVAATHKNAVAIQTLKDAGLVAGYKDGTYKPDTQVSRAEALSIIEKAVGIDTSAKTTAKLPFTDVSDKEWYFPVIAKAVALKKTKGYEDKTFRPNNPVTLPEALALSVSFYDVTLKKLSPDPLIEGLDRSDWYVRHAQYAQSNNIIELDENTRRLDPKAALTRGQLAEIIFRMRSVQKTGKAFDVTSSWVTEAHPANNWQLKRPADWEVFKGTQNAVLWKKDSSAASAPVFFTRMWPNMARLSISIVQNPEGLTPSQYFSRVAAMYTKNFPEAKARYSDVTPEGRTGLMVSIPKLRMVDLIVSLPNRNFLVMNGEYGEGPLGTLFSRQLETIELSYHYVDAPVSASLPLDDRMETLRLNILVPNKWKETLPLFPDKKLIHTDGIGIGTGPVDYYYSKEANHTIKLERGTSTILNIRESSTFAF